MPIPDAPPFAEFFSALEFVTFDTPHSLQSDAVTIMEPTVGTTANGQTIRYKGVAVRLKKQVTISIQGIIGKISQELKSKKHPHNDPVCLAVLGCAMIAAKSPVEVPAFLNRWFDSIREASVSHFFILEAETNIPPINMDGYTLGPLNLPSIRHLCKLAQSDFAELYGDRQRNRLCLHSPEFRRPVIDFLITQEELKITSETWRLFLLNYFEKMSQLHFEMMWNHLESAQQLRSAFGLDFFDSETSRKVPGTQMTSIYLGFSKVSAGYVVPHAQNLTLLLPSHYQSHAQAIENAYRVSSIGDSELGRMIKTLSRFHHQGRRYLRTEAFNEAALQFVIMLEHLFGEKPNIGEAIASRTAVATHLRLGKTYSDTFKEIKSLYGSRSKYVHEGTDISEEEARRLQDYSQAVLRVLFILHLNLSNHQKEFVQKWTKQLDWIKASFDAGLMVDSKILMENGLVAIASESPLEPRLDPKN